MEVMPSVLDCDSHLFESRTTWGDYIDPNMRDAALAIEDDELGWPWLTWRGRRLYPVESQVPGDAAVIGRERTRRDSFLGKKASDVRPIRLRESEGIECDDRWQAIPMRCDLE